MRKKIILVLTTLFVSIILLDVLSNYLKLPPQKWSKYNQFHKTYGWYTWNGSDHINNEHNLETNGFKTRGKKPSKEDKIILLGDSMVETSNKLNEMPENYLEKYLPKFSVISFGSWGWGQDQQLLHLKENIQKIKPKLIILWFVTNDLENNYQKKGFQGIKPSFKIKNNQLKYPKKKMGDVSMLPYFYNSYLVRVFYALKVKFIKDNFKIDNDTEKCNKKNNYTNYEELTKLYFDIDRYRQSKYPKENYPNPYNRKIVKFPIFKEWQKSSIQISSNSFYSSTSDMFAWNRDVITKKEKYKLLLTNLLLKEIEKIANDNNSELVIFFPIIDLDRFLPFYKDNEYKVCLNDKELNYSNNNVHKRINIIFKDLKNLYILKNEIKIWYDKFDGHPSNETNDYLMKLLSDFIKKNNYLN